MAVWFEAGEFAALIISATVCSALQFLTRRAAQPAQHPVLPQTKGGQQDEQVPRQHWEQCYEAQGQNLDSGHNGFPCSHFPPQTKQPLQKPCTLDELIGKGWLMARQQRSANKRHSKIFADLFLKCFFLSCCHMNRHLFGFSFLSCLLTFSVRGIYVWFQWKAPLSHSLSKVN